MPYVSEAGGFGVTMCTLAWSWTEIVRFSFYMMKQLKIEENFGIRKAIKFFRYNSFLLLYPMGCIGEVISAYRAWSLISGLPEFDKPHLVDWRPDYEPFSWVELLIKWVMPIGYAVFFP